MRSENLEVLDMDEHLIPTYRRIHASALSRCKERNATLDLATSDVCVYLYANSPEDAKYIADAYKIAGEQTFEKPDELRPGFFALG